MITPSAEGALGWYLRNALRSEASGELLKPIADGASVVLGTVPPGTAEELEGALDSSPLPRSGGEPLERNARFAAVEFGLTEAELDVLLLALRLRRSRPLARFCGAVQDALRDPLRAMAVLLDRDVDQVQSCVAPGARLLVCGLIEFDAEDMFGNGFASILAVSHAAVGAMLTSHSDRDAWRAALIGRPCEPGLPWACFDHLGPAPPLAARVLAAAAACGESGVHILLAGPPGTGKTELARALATRAGLALYAAGEASDSAGGEPSRRSVRRRCGSASPCSASAAMPLC